MTATRIYLPVFLNKGDICRTTADQSRYLRVVLRMKEGGRVVVFNGAGAEYETVIKSSAEAVVELEILEKREIPFPDVSVTLCQAIPKAEKMDGIIRHATELGANRIIPFLSARSIPRPDAFLSANKGKINDPEEKLCVHKLERWRKIAVEACRQSGRADVPEITNILTFIDMLASVSREGLRLIFWEEETEISLRDIFTKQRFVSPDGKNIPIRKLALAIGPEGGFSFEEVDLARRAGFVSVSLGKRVLRVETASLAALAVIQYEISSDCFRSQVDHV